MLLASVLTPTYCDRLEIKLSVIAWLAKSSSSLLDENGLTKIIGLFETILLFSISPVCLEEKFS